MTRLAHLSLLLLLVVPSIALSQAPPEVAGTDQDKAATWNFTSSTEGWTGRNAYARHSYDGDGRLYLDTYGNDPGLVSPTLSLPADTNDKLRMYVWTYCTDKNCDVYFMRSGSSTVFFGGSLNLSSGTSGGTYELDLSGNSNWTGTITQIRIDPSGYCGSVSTPGFVAFDWIATTDVAPQPITVVDPNGGELWEVGDTERIQWTNPGGYSSFTVAVSRNGGSTYSTIQSGLPGNFYYLDWDVTGPGSTNCRIKVTGYYSGGSNYDVSNSSFIICDPDLDVVYPNGGQTLYMGHDVTVTWSRTACSDSYIKIELYKGSSMVRQLSSSTPNDGSQTVNLPVDGSIAAGSDYRIALSATDGDPWDFSNSYFTILKPTLTVTNPSSGNSYQAGDVVNIQWTSNQVLGNVLIEVYNNGSHYQTLTTSTSNDGSYYWTIPASAPSSGCYTVDMSAMWGHVWDQSDCFQIIGCQADLDITYPDGGQTLYLGHDLEVTWNTTDCTGSTVKLELYKGPSSMVLQLNAGTPNDGSQTVNIPVDNSVVPGSDYRIAIAEPDGDPYDFSAGYFTLATPALTITNPLGGEHYQQGDVVDITWTSNQVLGNIHIEVYVDDLPYQVLNSSAPNTGLLQWTIPGDFPDSYRVEVGMSAMGGIMVYSFSDFFTVGDPPLPDYPESAFYWQKDPAWSGDSLGEGGCALTVGGAGCAVSCVAMLHTWESGSGTDYTPGTLNTWLEANGGFSGCLIIWEVAEDADQENNGLEHQARLTGTNDNWGVIDGELDGTPYNPIMAEVRAPLTGGGTSQHFVVVYSRIGPSGDPSSYLILDPLESSFDPLNPPTLAKYTGTQTAGVTSVGLVTWEGNFPWNAPSLELTYPNSAATYNCGDDITITWDFANIETDIHIQPYRGEEALPNINPSAPNTGSYQWTFPQDWPTSSDYWIGISAHNGLVWSVSPNFTVVNDVSDVAMETMPTVPTLFAPFPNPFNPRVALKFALPEAGHVSLDIYDLQGRRVARLVDESRDQGIYTEHWEAVTKNGMPLGSGIYLARMTSGDYKIVKKLMLTK